MVYSKKTLLHLQDTFLWRFGRVLEELWVTTQQWSIFGNYDRWKRPGLWRDHFTFCCMLTLMGGPVEVLSLKWRGSWHNSWPLFLEMGRGSFIHVLSYFLFPPPWSGKISHERRGWCCSIWRLMRFISSVISPLVLCCSFWMGKCSICFPCQRFYRWLLIVWHGGTWFKL